MVREEKEESSGGSIDLGRTLCHPPEKHSCPGPMADAEDSYRDISGQTNYLLKGAEQCHLDV